MKKTLYILIILITCAIVSIATGKYNSDTHHDVMYYDKKSPDEGQKMLYDIIFDIATRDRNSYHAIMRYLFAKKEIGIGLTAGERTPGAVDYAIEITAFDDEEGRSVKFDGFYQGSYRTDYSDVKKADLGRETIYPREGWVTMQKDIRNRMENKGLIDVGAAYFLSDSSISK